MATWIQGHTQTFTQMGGEGVTWLGIFPFTTENHIFANMGDGTYYHSGLLAIRAAVAARANITYKILYNDAVAMTGGQPVDGPLSVYGITHQLQAEGVDKIVVLSEQHTQYDEDLLPEDVKVLDRSALGATQEELRQTPGVTALIYDQTCAAEKRRRRKRGLMEDPKRRIFINETVCEGCGDCGKKSNCLSIAHQKTEWGVKRIIDQYSCNKDYTCIQGFCPSFVSVIGGRLKKPTVTENTSFPNKTIYYEDLCVSLPEPSRPNPDHVYRIFIAGVGGTGVVTVSALLSMAAHLEGQNCATVDMTGLAQKGGSVFSHVSLSTQKIFAPRVHEADLLLGFDPVVAASAEALGKITKTTQVVINDHGTLTGQCVRNPDETVPLDTLKKHIAAGHQVNFFDAHDLAVKLLGNALMSNMVMIGYAFQKGLLPLSSQAILRALELNGTLVEENKKAFQWGRLYAHNRSRILDALQTHTIDSDHQLSTTIDAIIQRREEFLEHYQNRALGRRYVQLVKKVQQYDQGKEELTRIVAQTYFQVLSYKDEYEVARLYTDGSFKKRLRETFEGRYRLVFHLAPPLLSRKDPRTGIPQKRSFGGWVLPLFKLLAAFKFLRGTPFDIFGYLQERRHERAFIRAVEQLIAFALRKIKDDPSARVYEQACALLLLPQKVRGYGPVKEQNRRYVMQKIRQQVEAMEQRAVQRNNDI